MLNINAMHNNRSVLIVAHYYDPSAKAPYFIAVDRQTGAFIYDFTGRFQVALNDPLLR